MPGNKQAPSKCNATTFLAARPRPGTPTPFRKSLRTWTAPRSIVPSIDLRFAAAAASASSCDCSFFRSISSTERPTQVALFHSRRWRIEHRHQRRLHRLRVHRSSASTPPVHCHHKHVKLHAPNCVTAPTISPRFSFLSFFASLFSLFTPSLLSILYLVLFSVDIICGMIN